MKTFLTFAFAAFLGAAALAAGKKESFNFAYFDKMLEASQGESFVASPLAAAGHLLVVSDFTRGETQKELKEFFAAYTFFEEYEPSQIVIKYRETEINFIDKKVAVFASENFRKTLENSDILDSVLKKTIHIENLSEDPAGQIKDFVDKSTLGMNKDFNANLPSKNPDLIVFGNLYLKCFWERQYDKSKKMPFYRPANEVLNIDFCCQEKYIYFLESKKFTFAFDPFFDSGGALFAMPKDGYSFKDLTKAEFDEFFQKAKRKRVQLEMPTFEILTDEKRHIEAMSKLGVKKIFSPEAELGLGLKNFAQMRSQNSIRFDRNGVVASSANLFSCCFGGTADPEILKLNKPFAFFVMGADDHSSNFDIKSLSQRNIIFEGVFTGKGDVKLLDGIGAEWQNDDSDDE